VRARALATFPLSVLSPSRSEDLPKKFNRNCGQRGRGIASGYGNHDGSVAAEFALMAPIIVLIATGIADFGMLATNSAGLAATARIGAEYARTYPDDASGIQHAMQSAMSFGPALTFPASFPRSCECNDETPITCSESCATIGRPGLIACSSGSRQTNLLHRWCAGRAFPRC
jgi:hypothetical protein